MKRRLFLGAALLGMAGAGAGGAGLTFRWHDTPRTTPFLTDDHLGGLGFMAPRPPRILFVGNSFTLRHDVPAQVAAAAQLAGRPVQVAMAAADGARLVGTWRLPEFRAALIRGWDIVVLQDFSTTCLRATDRWGSAWAMRRIVDTAQPRAVLLYPTWGFPPEHRVYSGKMGRFLTVPDSPRDLSERITAFYDGVAQRNDWHRAPVTEALMPDPRPWLAEDIHHLNADGAAKVAAILWQALAPLVQALPRA